MPVNKHANTPSLCDRWFGAYCNVVSNTTLTRLPDSFVLLSALALLVFTGLNALKMSPHFKVVLHPWILLSWISYSRHYWSEWFPHKKNKPMWKQYNQTDRPSSSLQSYYFPSCKTCRILGSKSQIIYRELKPFQDTVGCEVVHVQ